MAAATLESQLKSAQSAITFLQKQHSSVLNGLHQEIKNLQRKCNDLQYGLNVHIGLVQSGQFFEEQISQLQDELAEKTQMCQQLESQLALKDVEIEKLRNQLQWRETEMRSELSEKTIRLKDLQDKLQERTELLAHLSSHLRHVRHPAPSTGSRTTNSTLTDDNNSIQSPAKHLKTIPSRSSTPNKRLLPKRPQKSDIELIHVIHPPMFPDASTIDTNSTTASLDSNTDSDYLPPDFKAAVAALPPIRDMNQSTSTVPRTNQTYHLRRTDLSRTSIQSSPATHNLVDVTTLTNAVDNVSPDLDRRRRLKSEAALQSTDN